MSSIPDGGRLENNENIPPFSAMLVQEVLANVPVEYLGIVSNAVWGGIMLIPPVNWPYISTS